MAKYKDCATAPLVVGGVYEKLNDTGLKQRVLVTSATQAVNGTWQGEAHPYGSGSAETFIEGTETMAGWALVAQPEELAEPVTSDDLVVSAEKRLEKEKAVLEQRINLLEKQAKGEGLTPNQVLEMVERHQKTFSDISKSTGVHHATVRKLYNDAKSSRQAPRAGG